MKRQRKKYATPYRPWDKERIEVEKKLISDFGLKSKRELWKTEALLRKYRRLARELIGKQDKDKEKALIEKLSKLGVLTKDASLDNVLGLSIEDFLNRRLQTVLAKKNLVNTVGQARQFITHGHVMIEDRKVTYPSYMVPLDDEAKLVVRLTPVKKISGEVNGGTAN